MATVASIPLIGFCPEKKARADLFVEATRDLVALHSAEAETLTEGETLERIDTAIALARERKDEIKLAYQLTLRGTGVRSRDSGAPTPRFDNPTNGR
jgi:hypothetical protein